LGYSRVRHAELSSGRLVVMVRAVSLGQSATHDTHDVEWAGVACVVNRLVDMSAVDHIYLLIQLFIF
jgi:hypothetical protein